MRLFPQGFQICNLLSYAVLGRKAFLCSLLSDGGTAVLITLLLGLSKPDVASSQSAQRAGRDFKHLQLPSEASGGMGPGQIFDLPSENK